MSDPKPCHYDSTGKSHTLRVANRPRLAMFWVRCATCGREGPSRKTEEQAVEAWNYRPREEAVLDAAIDRLTERSAHHINDTIARGGSGRLVSAIYGEAIKALEGSKK